MAWLSAKIWLPSEIAAAYAFRQLFLPEIDLLETDLEADASLHRRQSLNFELQADLPRI